MQTEKPCREDRRVSMETFLFLPELSGGLKRQDAVNNHDVCSKWWKEEDARTASAVFSKRVWAFAVTHNGRCVNPQVITPGPVRGDAQRPARTGSPKRTARKNMTAESVDYKAMQEAVHNYLTSRKAGIFFSVSGVSVVPVCSIISIPHNTYNRIIKGIKNTY